MQGYNDNELRITKENSLYEFIAYTTVGDREEQQDSFGFQMKNSSLLAIVCDGMGGHKGGASASRLAVDELLEKLDLNNAVSDIPEYFLQTLRETDIKVSSIKDGRGDPLGAGTTAVVVIIKNNDLYWCSAGDSRIYIIRGDEMIQATCDHIYRLILDRQLFSGEISEDEYTKEVTMGDALISFLGAGNLPMTDINNEPFRLYKDDVVILTSDGLYKYLSEQEIKSIICNFSDLDDAVEAIDSKVRRASKKISLQRDNMTVIIIKIKK